MKKLLLLLLCVAASAQAQLITQTNDRIDGPNGTNSVIARADGKITINAATGETITINGALLMLTTATTFASSVALDFNTTAYETIAVTGNITLTTSNRAAVKTKVVKLTADHSGPYNFTVGESWIVVGTAAPATIPADKTLLVSLTCMGTGDTDVIATFAAQP